MGALHQEEAKAFFQGVTSVRNLLVDFKGLKVEAVEPIREGDLWAVYIMVEPDPGQADVDTIKH